MVKSKQQLLMMVANEQENEENCLICMDAAAHISALEAKCAELEEQLASMTAERDSESRWAKQYHDEAVALREQLDAEQERINEPEEGAQ